MIIFSAEKQMMGKKALCVGFRREFGSEPERERECKTAEGKLHVLVPFEMIRCV